MFNPKQALERLRKQRIQQQQQSQVLKSSDYDRPLFPQPFKTKQQPIINHVNIFNQKQQTITLNKAQTIQERMARLEALVSNLNDKLTQSNQTIVELKQQNNHLQQQVLKLSHQNSLLAQKQTIPQQNTTKNSLVQRLNNSIQGFGNRQDKRVITSLSNDEHQIKKVESKIAEDDVFSEEVEEMMKGIKRQTLQNILKRKQQNFRALKNASKQTIGRGQKALRQLANMQKQYGKNYKKPTLIINLEENDFQ